MVALDMTLQLAQADFTQEKCQMYVKGQNQA